MAIDLPCVVWVDITPGSKYGVNPKFGLLLEWRQRHDKRGNPYWEGFVVTGDAPTDVHGVEVSATWYRGAYLTPVDAPRPPKRS